MDDLENTDTILFSDLLNSFNLVNEVNFPSHKLQHTLDLAIIDSEYSYLSKVSRGHMLSDHSFIHCDLSITKPLPLTKSVHCRKLKAIDHSHFKVNLIESLNMSVHSSLYDMVASYNKTLSTILDNNAPVKEKTWKITHAQPWLNVKICNEIRLRRKKNQAWNSWPTEYNYIAFYNQRQFISNILKTAQRIYYNNILENKYDTKTIFKIANNLLFRNELLFHQHLMETSYLAECFNNFFKDKIENIMVKLPPTSDNQVNAAYIKTDYLTAHRCRSFELSTIEKIIAITQSALPTSCDLDPIPTTILKQHMEVIAPSIQKSQ